MTPAVMIDSSPDPAQPINHKAFRLFDDGAHHPPEHVLIVDNEHPYRTHRRSPPPAIIGVVIAPQ